MINNTDYEATYQTVADQTAWYPIPFVYFDNPATNTPELVVNLDGNALSYPSDYIVSSQGLQLTTTPTAGLTLTIFRNPTFEQLIDFQTGIIDPEQIESGFDRSVMRDLYLHGWIGQLEQDTTDRFNQLSPVAWSGDYSDLINIPIFATVANTGDYNDLLNKPTIGNGTITITQGGVVKGLFTTNQTGNATIALDSGLTTVDWSDVTNKPTFATVATTGNYNDLLNKPTIPTVGNGTITLTQGGVTKGTFTTNQSGNTTIALDAGGGSSLPSQTGHSGEFLTTDGTDPAWAIATSVTFRVWGANE
jgi:hypothetical protein